MIATLFAAVSTILGQPPADAAQPTPTVQRIVPPDKRYIADAFTLRGGDELAYVTTDADRSNATVHLVDLAATDRKIAIPIVAGRLESLRWLGPGRVLVITRAGRGKQLIGRVLTPAGLEPASVGPADHIGLWHFEGDPVVTAYTQLGGKRGQQHRLAAFDVVDLKPRISRTFAVDGRRRMKLGSQEATLLWWGDDFTTAAVRHPGVYDETRDIRLPDRFGRVDLLTDKLLIDAAIEPAGFARLTSLQRLYPGRSVFVHPDPGAGKLLLIDGAHWREIKPARPLEAYDLGRTLSQELDAGQVLVSLAMKDGNRDEIELYSVNRQTGAMTRKLVLDGGFRPVVWSASGTTLAVLRKHRTFAAGGVALELYRLSSAAGSQSPS